MTPKINQIKERAQHVSLNDYDYSDYDQLTY